MWPWLVLPPTVILDTSVVAPGVLEGLRLSVAPQALIKFLKNNAIAYLHRTLLNVHGQGRQVLYFRITTNLGKR